MTTTRCFTTALLLVLCSALNTTRTVRAAEGEFTATDLRCEYLVNPIGIDQTAPRLSWRIESNVRGVRQTAYRILVASTRQNIDDNRGDLWDSGKVESRRPSISPIRVSR